MHRVRIHCSLDNTSATEVVNFNDWKSILNNYNCLQEQISSPTISKLAINYRSTDMYTMISQRQYQHLVSRMNELTETNKELEEAALRQYADEIMSRPDVIALMNGDVSLEDMTETYEEFIKRVPEAKIDD